EQSPVVGMEKPTTCPLALIELAALVDPPGSVPRSVIVQPVLLGVQRQACPAPLAVSTEPTTSPLALMAAAPLSAPACSGGSSVIVQPAVPLVQTQGTA